MTPFAHPADARSLSAVCVVKDSQDIVLAQVAWTDIRVWDVDRPLNRADGCDCTRHTDKC